MSDPSLALQGAIVQTLKGDGAITALVAAVNIVDDVPPGIAFPYITVGEGHVIGDDTEDCGDASEVFQQIHVWSRLKGFPETKRIASAVRTSLRNATLTLSGFAISVTEYVQTQFLKDPDGLTRHAVVEFRYLITHTS